MKSMATCCCGIERGCRKPVGSSHEVWAHTQQSVTYLSMSRFNVSHRNLLSTIFCVLTIPGCTELREVCTQHTTSSHMAWGTQTQVAGHSGLAGSSCWAHCIFIISHWTGAVKQDSELDLVWEFSKIRERACTLLSWNQVDMWASKLKWVKYNVHLSWCGISLLTDLTYSRFLSWWWMMNILLSSQCYHSSNAALIANHSPFLTS